MARQSSGARSGVCVAALTAAALAVVSFFAYQASAAKDDASSASPSASTSQGAEGANGSKDQASGNREESATSAPPAESGEGRRVVYSLSERRVWLVDVSDDGTGEVISDTFRVYPSAVDPPTGEYEVTSRTAATTGSDGVPVEHVVVFHVAADGTVFGFSAATDGSLPDADSGPQTGAIRQSRADGTTMWRFADAGLAVVVVN